MKFIKDILRWVFIVSFIVTLMFLSVGCDESDTDTQGNKPASECVTISICFPPVPHADMSSSLDALADGNPTNIASIREMLDVLNARTQQELNTKIDLVWLRNDPKLYYDEQLMEVLPSIEAPDAFLINCGMLEKLCRQDLVMDITKLFPTIAGAYYMLLSEQGSPIDDSSKYDGRIYAIPNNVVTPPQRFCVIARDDLVDKYLPQGIITLDDYCAFLSAVKDNETGITPGIASAHNFVGAYMLGSGYYHITWNVVGRWDENGIIPMLEYETDDFINACELYKELKSSRAIVNVKNRKDPIQEGKLASVLCNMSLVRYEYPWFASICKYRMYPLNMDNYCLQADYSGSAIGINNNTKNADRVLEFIAWLHSNQENYDLFMYGIKDRHYKLSGEYLDLNDLQDVKPIAGWEGSEAFMNYHLERPYPYEPEDHLDFRRECASTNIMTQEELCVMKGYEYNPEFFELSENNIRAVIEEYEEGLLDLQDSYLFFGLENPDFANFKIDRNLKQIIDSKGLSDEFENILNYYIERLGNHKCDFLFNRYPGTGTRKFYPELLK